jgi:hypothetical protein
MGTLISTGCWTKLCCMTSRSQEMADEFSAQKCLPTSRKIRRSIRSSPNILMTRKSVATKWCAVENHPFVECGDDFWVSPDFESQFLLFVLVSLGHNLQILLPHSLAMLFSNWIKRRFCHFGSGQNLSATCRCACMKYDVAHKFGDHFNISTRFQKNSVAKHIQTFHFAKPVPTGQTRHIAPVQGLLPMYT